MPLRILGILLAPLEDSGTGPEERRESKGEEPEIEIPNLAAYCELVVSRRPLKRVAGQPGCLRDAESNEVFRTRCDLDLWVAQRS